MSQKPTKIPGIPKVPNDVSVNSKLSEFAC